MLTGSSSLACIKTLPVLILWETCIETLMAWRYIQIQDSNNNNNKKKQKHHHHHHHHKMNYVPGTASLIDDIDSKLEEWFDGFGLKRNNRFKMCSIVSDAIWIICSGFKLSFNVLLLFVSHREAPGAAPRWKNIDWLPEKHWSVW